jgi:hypothetical protein
MAKTKFICPSPPPVGSGTFSDDLVGLQLVSGGGLTLGNFEFTTSVYEKVSRTFDTGVFSDPFNLENLNIESIAETKLIIEKNFRVYPNFDLAQITSFSLYGSLSKRISASVNRVINYFPAAIEVYYSNYILQTGNTAYNITYNTINDETTFDTDSSFFKNPFDIDYSVNAKINVANRPIPVSKYRDITNNFESFSLYVNNLNTEFNVVDLEPTQSVTGGTLTITVKGKPFTSTTTTDTLVIKPNNLVTEQIFQDAFDEVEDYILNRNAYPKYTATFSYPDYDSNGNYILFNKSLTWNTDGLWNLDIRTNYFDNYLTELQYITERLDEYKTNLISRFLTSGSLKEFDTIDQKIEKTLQIYGRSFDETKKFIDALANITSVNYIVKNDIPSQLLGNLAATLGIDPNISPITNDSLLESIFTTTNDIIYPGQSKEQTPTELNYQYYRNLILNAGFLFRSKGTRTSIEYIMRMIGAPDALIEFNEYIYLADQKISVDDFYEKYAKLSGGTTYVETPVLDSTNIFSILGTQYTGFTKSGVVNRTLVGLEYYPININTGYPEPPTNNNSFFFQKGAGWFETTPDHRSAEEIDYNLSNFSVSPSIVITKLKPFTYGQDYIDRFDKFPSMDLGYGLTRTIDNKKSWKLEDIGLRKSTDINTPTNYLIEDSGQVVNVKNMELYLNMGQGITYDIWEMSAKYGYPIPNSGLTAPYPTPGLNDWTVIDPKPNQKTFFEFAQTFYNNLINVRNRQTISDGKTGGYPALQSIFWKYLQTDQTLNIPNNKFTYQKMIDFTLGLGDYWVRLVEQFVPATTIWNTGQKMDNSIFNRQKFVWRRQRGCTFIFGDLKNTDCLPCIYDGSPYTYDCIDQTTQCSLPTFDPVTVLNAKINDLYTSSGFTSANCDSTTMISTWYVDLTLTDTVTNIEDTLISEPFYVGYGQSAIDLTTGLPLSYYDVINAIDSKLQYLYQYGLNYYFSGGVLTISNSSCYDNFTNKQLNLYIGLDLQINCG